MPITRLLSEVASRKRLKQINTAWSSKRI